MLKVEEVLLRTLEERQNHLDLELNCLERGGNSTNHKGVLSEFFCMEIPSGFKLLLCHACENSKCSEPKHLYWGTPKENKRDAIISGRAKSPWEYVVLKHGLESAKKLNKKSGFTSETAKIAVSKAWKNRLS